MSIKLKATLVALMSLALFFGYFHLFVSADIPHNFERLHIFLFNLCSGGTILLYYSERQRNLSCQASFFLITAITYAICAFFEIYAPAMLLALVLAGIVERVRIRRFSVLPSNFFHSNVPVAEKFHQASLLCLSIALLISCLVIGNNEYLKFISSPKLKMDTFFLGFSFPLSLITMSVMFALIKENFSSVTHFLKDLAFWTVNLGVIIFFAFILFEKLILQLVIAAILSCTVILIFCLFRKYAHPVQQKHFLTSGMGFLLCTAVTGILYLLLKFFPEYRRYQEDAYFLLRMHTFLSLYGWNLSGLAIISRYDDFPIRLDSKIIITCHWVIVVLLAPLGNYYRPIAILVTLCYTFFVCIMFFSQKSDGTDIQNSNLTQSTAKWTKPFNPAAKRKLTP